mgnify:CR=1 FL=1
MTAFVQQNCIHHKKNKAEYFIHVKNKVYCLCKECWDLATKIHQLSLNALEL